MEQVTLEARAAWLALAEQYKSPLPWKYIIAEPDLIALCAAVARRAQIEALEDEIAMHERTKEFLHLCGNLKTADFYVTDICRISNQIDKLKGPPHD